MLTRRAIPPSSRDSRQAERARGLVHANRSFDWADAYLRGDRTELIRVELATNSNAYRIMAGEFTKGCVGARPQGKDRPQTNPQTQIAQPPNQRSKHLRINRRQTTEKPSNRSRTGARKPYTQPPKKFPARPLTQQTLSGTRSSRLCGDCRPCHAELENRAVEGQVKLTADQRRWTQMLTPSCDFLRNLRLRSS